jgi:hypothetical protein
MRERKCLHQQQPNWRNVIHILPPLTIADETDLDLEGVPTIEFSSTVSLEIKNYHPEECRFFLRAVLPNNLVTDVFSVQSETALVAYLGIP